MFVLAKLAPNEGDLSVKHLGGVRRPAPSARAFQGGVHQITAQHQDLRVGLLCAAREPAAKLAFHEIHIPIFLKRPLPDRPSAAEPSPSRQPKPVDRSARQQLLTLISTVPMIVSTVLIFTRRASSWLRNRSGSPMRN